MLNVPVQEVPADPTSIPM